LCEKRLYLDDSHGMEQMHRPVKGSTSLFLSPINFVYVGFLFKETAHNASNPLTCVGTDGEKKASDFGRTVTCAVL
jgi:hypothetical protein